MDDRRAMKWVAAGGALVVAAVVVMGGTSPSQDLVFERAQNDIDTLPPEFAEIGVALPPDQTRHAGILRDMDYWVGRGMSAGSTCLFVLPRYDRPRAACGDRSVTLELDDGTQAVYPIPQDIDEGDGVLVGGVLLVEDER